MFPGDLGPKNTPEGSISFCQRYHLSMSDRARLPHFKELDGLRGLASLAIFYHHFFQINSNPHALVSLIALPARLGVQVFFVLSGFLITALLLIERGEFSMIRNFYWKRVLRIWPALLIYLGVIYLINAWAGNARVALPYILLSLLFMSNFEGLFGSSFTLGPTWTLAIEEQFYLIWPQIVRVCRTTTVFWTSFAVFAISVILRTVVPLARHDSISLIYTPYQCDGLGLGAMIACQWFAPRRLSGNALRVARFLNGRVVVGPWVLLLALDIWRMPGWGNLYGGIDMTLVTFATYRLLVLIVLKRSKRLGWLGVRPLVFLGSISYGLYLYHSLVILGTGHAGDMSHPLRVVERFVLGASLSIAVSYLSLRFVEMPIRQLRKYVVNVQASVPDEINGLSSEGI